MAAQGDVIDDQYQELILLLPAHAGATLALLMW